MDNHNRSKKHAENVSRLLLEVGDDDDEDNKDVDNVDEAGNLSDADADDVQVADDLPDLSQSRYDSFDPVFICISRTFGGELIEIFSIDDCCHLALELLSETSNVRHQYKRP